LVSLTQTGKVTKQQILENPRPIHKVLLCDFKIAVWCSVNTDRVSGLIFKDTFNSERYVDQMLHILLKWLTDEN
jgi:hypothetical protein